MIRFCAWTVTVGMMAMAASGGAAGPAAATGADGAAEVRTMTGWFSDAQCAAPKVKKGIIAMNNPDCVKTCLKKGVAAVFISEQAKAMFEVRGHAAVAEDVGWHVEVTGRVDEAGQIIDIQSVKRLSEEGSTCALRRKKTDGAVTTPTGAAGAQTRNSASGR
jgi:hypothetical protein